MNHIECIDNKVEHQHKVRLNAVVQFDPTRTLTLRNRFVRDMEKRFNQLKRDITKHIVEEDALGANEKRNVFDFSTKINAINLEIVPSNRSEELKKLKPKVITNIFEYTRSQAKAESFMRWLDRMEEQGILEQAAPRLGAAPTLQPWTNQYIQSSYQKGILRARQELNAIGVPVTTGDPFGVGISAVFNQPIHVDRMGLLFTRTFEDLKGIDSVMDSQISRTLTQGMAEGLSPRTIARRLNDRVDKIGKVRARALARTEIIRAHHSANVQEYRMAGIEKVRVKAEWVTAGFNVCFSAWTFVNTDKGIKPIHKLVIGDLVHTRQGLKKVLATSKRRYKGNMIKLKTNIGKTFVTDEHPYWDINKGWIPSRQLTLNSSLQSFSNKSIDVLSVSDFNIGYSANANSFISKKGIFIKIFNRIMPINSVYFKSDFVFRNVKINAISTYRKFLNMFNFKKGKRFSNRFFRSCFSSEFPIATKATENTITSRNSSKFFFTFFANFNQWRSSTFLRAIMPFKSSCKIPIIILKRFVASFASNKSKRTVLSRRSFYFASITVFVCAALFCFKKFFACRTFTFDNSDFLFISFIALYGTESCIGISSLPFTTRIKRFFTKLTYFIRKSFCRVMVTGRRTKNMGSSFINTISSNKRLFTKVTNEFKRHYYSLRSSLNISYYQLYHIRPNVYNLKIEDVPEFYANGILVHNCPICSGNEGKIFTLRQIEGLIPAHPNCRCVIVPVVQDEELFKEPTSIDISPDIKKDLSQEQIDGVLKRIILSKRAKINGDKLIVVDTKAFDNAFKKDTDFYIGRGGEGGVKGRYEGFQKFIKKGTKIEASEVVVTDEGRVVFVNGRHRWAVERDIGMKEISVAMSSGSEANSLIFNLK